MGNLVIFDGAYFDYLFQENNKSGFCSYVACVEKKQRTKKERTERTDTVI